MLDLADVPAEFFVFVNRTSMMTRHNLDLIGGFSSSCADLIQTPAGQDAYDGGEVQLLPFVPADPPPAFISVFTMNATSLYGLEYEAERVRKLVAPKAPSRLSAVYAFGNYPSCEEAAAKYGWDLASVRRFRLAQHLSARVVRVNMEIVSLMRTVATLGSVDQATSERVWSHYWAGGGEMKYETPPLTGFTGRQIWESGELWEYLIEGRIEVVE